ncbi:MAG: hypothetical protein CL780_00365 [Chloroflexi bacterium]|nr:hypothetical protein [Chloroflexota bacterium]|tara:strand:- start:1303 stop:1593 length:291 start_codon:yes stop_codon:yes gene_type:complete
MKVLEEKEIQYKKIDIFKDRLSLENINEILLYVDINDIFSWSSPSAKPYRTKKSTIKESELISLILSEPKLIRRPILLIENKVVIGFKQGYYDFIN